MMHHSSVAQLFSPLSSPPLSSNRYQVHYPEPQGPSPHLGPQVNSPQLDTSPQQGPHVHSPHLGHQVNWPHPRPQVNSPHQGPQVTSPHLGPQVHSPQLVNSSHLGPQVTSPHQGPLVHSPHLGPQFNWPHLGPKVTSPHLGSEVHSPHLVNSPHLGPQVSSPRLETQVTSPYQGPQVHSPHLGPQFNWPHPGPQVTSPHQGPQVNSPHLGPQVSSPRLETQVTSPYQGPQVHSPHLGPQFNWPHLGSKVTSPHLGSEVNSPQLVTSPHQGPQVHSPHLVNSPHLGPQVSSPRLETQVTSPYQGPQVPFPYPVSQVPPSHYHQEPQGTFPHPVPQGHSCYLRPQTRAQHHLPEPLVPFPNLVPQDPSSHHHQVPAPHPVPHSQVPSPSPVPYPLQNQVYDHNPDLDDPAWSRAEPSYLNGYDYTNQNHNLDLQNHNLDLQNHNLDLQNHDLDLQNLQNHNLDLQNQDQDQFSTGVGAYNSATQQAGGMYGQEDQPGLDLATWKPSLEQLQYPTPGSRTGGVPQESWSSMEFNSSSSEDFSSTQYYQNHYGLCSPPSSRPGLQGLPEYERITSDLLHQLLRGEQVHDQSGLLDTAENSGNQDVVLAAQPDVQILKIKPPKPKTRTEVLKSRLSCTLCQRDFRSLPALNGHMRSHRSPRPAAGSNKSEDTVLPVQTSVSMATPVPIRSRGMGEGPRRGRRRCGQGSPVSRPLYRSLLHQEEEGETTNTAAGAHYTPPPMLYPLRAGPGLFSALATRKQNMETALTYPRINEGRSFQAEIPPLRDRKQAEADSHNALLLWMPWEELEGPAGRQRVEALMMMVRSSVVPGGGASPEAALHVLSECRGDFLLTVDKLLSPPKTSNHNNHLRPQRPPSADWSAAERRLLVRSLQLYHKDFSRIQKAVQTKTLHQCVEFYYLWKRKLGLKTWTRSEDPDLIRGPRLHPENPENPENPDRSEEPGSV